MQEAIELVVDVSEAADLGQEAWVALTVHLPDARDVQDPPTVCFAKPGGGYSRHYFTQDLPGPGRGAQAPWHAERGWIFVSVDYLGAGGSSAAHEPGKLGFTRLAATSWAAEQEVLSRLAEGRLAEDFPPVTEPVLLGIGQSLGGCMTVVQQGQHHCYDGIGVLGWSSVHDHPPARPGDPPIVMPWISRDELESDPPIVVNAEDLAGAAARTSMAMAWGFFYDDVDPAIVRGDLEDFPARTGRAVPPWGSATVPGAVGSACLTPGVIAAEAAAVRVPVLVALGERDVSSDPKGELRAYRSSTSVDLFVCPRMGHMHNFAGTRELLWERLDRWAAWVRTTKSYEPTSTPQR